MLLCSMFERGGRIMGNFYAVEVAEYIIGYANEQNYPISNLKLQKILYFIQAQFLVTLGYPCFKDFIEAWDFGPVVRSVYNQYKRYGSANIYLGNMSLETKMKEVEKFNIQLVVDKCANFSANQLVEITHNQDPWRNAYKRDGIIYNDEIRRYFG